MTELSFIHRFEPGARSGSRPLLLLHGTGEETFADGLVREGHLTVALECADDSPVPVPNAIYSQRRRR